jgi:hypothetical protein
MRVHFTEELDSIIETIYLGYDFDEKISNSDIIVNPGKTTYITSNKVVIINDPTYPIDKVEALKRNGCKIISRINTKIEGVIVEPYILRPNFSIVWNGDELESPNYGNILESTMLVRGHGVNDHKLLFPKIYGPTWIPAIDLDGNLTCLGWALQQVGINLKKDTPFKDLDVTKTLKQRF